MNNFPCSQVGLVSSLPYLGRFVGAQIVGFISGQLTKRDVLAPLTLQKINTCTEFIFPAAGSYFGFYIPEQQKNFPLSNIVL